MEELGEKRDLSDLRPVESKTKFRIFGIKNGKLAKGAIITVPPEVVSKLSPEQKASLTAAVEAVTETVVDNTKAEKDAEAKKGKGEKKFNKKLLLIIPCIAMVLPMVMKSCDGRLLKSIDDRTTTPTATASESVKEDVTVVTETKQIEATIYQIDYTEEALTALTGNAGQESATRAAQSGDGMFDEGPMYSAEEQFETEEQASGGIEQSIEIREQIALLMEVLTNQDSSQEDIYNAAKRITELMEQIDSKYRTNRSLAEQQAARFEEASIASKDSNTENEIKVVQAILQDYKDQLGLTANNINAMNMIIDLCEQGYEVKIQGIKNLRGDYTITGEAIKKMVVVMQEGNEVKKAWDGFKQCISEKTIENPINEQDDGIENQI